MEDIDVIKQGKQTKEHLEVYTKNQMQLYKFVFAEKTAKLSTFLFLVFFISLLTLLVLISLSLAMGIYLGKLFNSYALAAIAVAGLYILFGFGVYAFRNILFLNPLLKSLIKEMEH